MVNYSFQLTIFPPSRERNRRLHKQRQQFASISSFFSTLTAKKNQNFYNDKNMHNYRLEINLLLTNKKYLNDSFS